MSILSGPQRDSLAYRLYEKGYTYKDGGLGLGVTQERARQIVARYWRRNGRPDGRWARKAVALRQRQYPEWDRWESV